NRPIEVHLPASDELFQPLDTEPILAALWKMNDLLEAILNQPALMSRQPVESEVESGNFHFPPPPVPPKATVSPKLQMAMDFLKANPDTKLSNRAIAEKLSISHTWVNKARQLLESEDAKS